jgi:hypothetical protein
LFGTESHTISCDNLPRIDFGYFLANDGSRIGLQGNSVGTKVNYNKRLTIEGKSLPISNAYPSVVVAWYLIGC